MAKTNWQDPGSSEILSTHISGLQEAVGKIEESIGIDTVSETNIPLSEIYIADDDRCRIFQAPEGKRNWTLSPTPVIKKNGIVITDDFEIDYGGGAIIFTTPILETDTLTADATYTINKTSDLYSNVITYDNTINLPSEAISGQVDVIINGNTYTNKILNGDFRDGDSKWWGALGAVLSASNNTLYIKGSDVNANPYAYQSTDIPVQSGTSVFVRATFKILDDGADYIRMFVAGTDTGNQLPSSIKSVSQPVKDVIYTLYNKVTVPTNTDRTGNVRISLQHMWPFGEAVNKVLEVKDVMLLDLNQFRELLNLTADEINDRLPKFIDGTKSTLGAMRIKSVGKNLMDKDIGHRQRYWTKVKILPLHSYCLSFNGNLIGGSTLRPALRFFKKGVEITSGINLKIGDGSAAYYYGGIGIGYILGANVSPTFLRNNATIIYGDNDVDEIWISMSHGDIAQTAYFTQVQLEEGVTKTDFEPYKESNVYILAKEGNEIITLKSLPNGIKDEIRPDGKGGYELVKRLSSTLLSDQNLANYYTNSTNADLVRWTKPADSIGYNNTSTYWTNLKGVAEFVDTPWDVEAHINKYATFISPAVIDLAVSKGTFTDTNAAQAYYAANPLTLIYQLAEPEIIPVNWSGLQCYENGTIYFEKIVPEVGFYDNGLYTHYPNHPIESIDRLFKVDKETGLHTPLDITKCVISEDRLSFTHPDISDSDLISWDYVPTTHSTNAKKTLTFPANIKASIESLLKENQIQNQNIRQVNMLITGHAGNEEIHLSKEDREKLDGPSIELVNNLEETETGKALDATQGKVLATDISTAISLVLDRIPKNDIVDNLETKDATKVLSAKQGALLLDSIGSVQDTIAGKMDKSGGTFTGPVVFNNSANMNGQLQCNNNTLLRPKLTSYTEKYEIINNASGALDLTMENSNIYFIDVTGALGITISSVNIASSMQSITLLLQQGSTPKSITFDESIQWANGEIPNVSEPGAIYIVTIMLLRWGSLLIGPFGMFGGRFR